MKLLNNSGPAKFMYSIIAITLIASILCFYLYYSEIFEEKWVLIVGIVAFTIMYHFWVRIILGNISKLFRKNISYDQWWFKERKFEKKVYKFLNVKRWKGKVLTYNPNDFSLKEKSLEEIVNTTLKSELDHWINEAVSVSTMFFGFIWEELWLAFLISAIVAMIFDAQFIVIQRYNRPRLIKIIEKENNK